MVQGYARAAENHAARRDVADRSRLLSLQQDHLRAGCDARRRQARADHHHQAVLGDGRGPDAADLDRLDLRHELQDHAGAAMGKRLPLRAGSDAARRGGALHVFQMEEVVVGIMRYAVVIEKANGNYSAYVPDLPGCVATGNTVAAVESEIRDAIRFHIDGLRVDGIVVPKPTSIAEYVET